MLTDAEIDNLAKETLAYILKRIQDEDATLFQTLENAAGESVIIYSQISQSGYGAFQCAYLPLQAIRRIVVDAEKIYDEFTVRLTDSETGKTLERKVLSKQPPEDRLFTIKVMAECAGLFLIMSLRSGFCDLVEDTVDDAAIISNSLTAAVIAEHYSRTDIAKITVDVRPDIEKAAKKAADKRREAIAYFTKSLPNVLAARGRGRPTGTLKPKEKKAQDRVEFQKEIEAAMQRLLSAKGKMPTKTAVAKDLGIGGLNPATGIDSSLTSFNNKLKRLGIDYDAIVQARKTKQINRE